MLFRAEVTKSAIIVTIIFWTMLNTYGIFLVSLQKNKLNMKKIRLTCPECGCEDIEIVEDRYVRCTACGFEDDVEVFIS